MEIEVWSVGKAKFTADPEFQEPVIREVIDQRGDVADVIIDYTDSERSDISHDEYAVVTGDVPGLVLFEGWLTGDQDAPPPAASVTAPGQALADTWDAQALKCDEAAALPGLAKAAVLEQATFAAQLRDCARQLRDLPAQGPKAAPDRTAATESALRMALAFIEQVRDGAYGDLAGLDAQQALDEIGAS